MDIKNKIEEILLTEYQYIDCYTVNKLLDLFAVSSSICHCEKLPDGEIAISSKALQKPYGDFG